jgi:hypothetical protein
MDEIMRTPETKGWAEKRSVGRRDADRGVCLFHDMCHETMAEMRQNCIDTIQSQKKEHDAMETEVKSLYKQKLDWKVFALFVTGVVTIGIATVLFVAPLVMKMSDTITRIDTNQHHLMEELFIKPVK